MSASGKSSKKPYLITGALFIYAVGMALFNLDTITVQHEYLRYFGSLAAELIVLCLLFFFLKRRDKLKREREEDLRKSKEEEAK